MLSNDDLDSYTIILERIVQSSTNKNEKENGFTFGRN